MNLVKIVYTMWMNIADAITECLQIVKKIKDDYDDAKFGEQIPINYGTLCGIIIEFRRLKGEIK